MTPIRCHEPDKEPREAAHSRALALGLAHGCSLIQTEYGRVVLRHATESPLGCQTEADRPRQPRPLVSEQLMVRLAAPELSGSRQFIGNLDASHDKPERLRQRFSAE